MNIVDSTTPPPWTIEDLGDGSCHVLSYCSYYGIKCAHIKATSDKIIIMECMIHGAESILPTTEGLISIFVKP